MNFSYVAITVIAVLKCKMFMKRCQNWCSFVLWG